MSATGSVAFRDNEENTVLPFPTPEELWNPWRRAAAKQAHEYTNMSRNLFFSVWLNPQFQMHSGDTPPRFWGFSFTIYRQNRPHNLKYY